MAASEWEKLRRTATRYKEMYPPGTRVVLNHMEDPWSPVPAGTRGTVAAVDAIGQIHMKWWTEPCAGAWGGFLPQIDCGGDCKRRIGEAAGD